MTLTKSLASLIFAGLSLFAGSALAQDAADPALVAKGKYLAIAGDCGACHTTENGRPFAGGLALASPLGQIFSTNITPSKQFGIGNYSLEDFDRAVRHGVRKDGANLYPAMPYTAYSSVSDDDIKALYAYFMHGVEPVDEVGPRTSLPFPFNIRLSMMGWNLIFAHDKPFAADPSKSAQWNRGAYLAEGLAHCSTCHTPRNFLMAEEGGKALGGASLGTWFAPNITSDAVAGIGKWSVDDIAAYLSTGRSPTGSQAGGPMLEAIDKSFSKLDAKDVKAIATYIHGVAAQSMNAAPGKPVTTAPVLTDSPDDRQCLRRCDALQRSLRHLPSGQRRGQKRPAGAVRQCRPRASSDGRQCRYGRDGWTCSA